MKSTKKLAKAKRQGTLKAEVEHLAKVFSSKKHFLAWLQAVIKNNIDKIPNIVAICGMTLVIKRLIDTTEELRSRVNTYSEYFKRTENISAFTGVGMQFIPADIVREVESIQAEPFEGMFPDWADWLIAFSLAYIVVNHLGAILQGVGSLIEGTKGLAKVLLFLI